MRRPFLVLIALSSILLGACSTSSSTTTPTTSIAPPTTTPPSTQAPTTTTPPKATRGATSSAQAAADLVSAWESHDHKAAAQIADAHGVEGIFATPDPAMWIRGCTTDDAIDQGGCVYRTEAGLVQINTEHRSIGWVVTSAVYDRIDDDGLPSDSGNAPDSPPPTTVPQSTTVPPSAR